MCAEVLIKIKILSFNYNILNDSKYFPTYLIGMFDTSKLPVDMKSIISQ